MPPVVIGPSEPGQPDSEIAVCLTIPEEFAGMSMSELEFRQGFVIDMEVQHGRVSVRATLPASAYAGLVEAIEVSTQGRGKVERVVGQ